DREHRSPPAITIHASLSDATYAAGDSLSRPGLLRPDPGLSPARAVGFHLDALAAPAVVEINRSVVSGLAHADAIALGVVDAVAARRIPIEAAETFRHVRPRDGVGRDRPHALVRDRHPVLLRRER